MVCEELPSDTAPSPELIDIASPSSAESSFRELDDAFLQTQTRIWLGEVLKIRLDEQPMIAEQLADGELLFQVSKVVWKLLLVKHTELRHIKAYKSQPFASKKSSGRYRPYSNVDSFLKICKILGLTGIDLFSPSDVVERKNTRRVCMCIRSFSKKSRSMNINVPDFDIVTCMVAMPKDLVGCIRRNIEMSHSILADSSSYLQKKSRQGYSVTGSTSDWETYSDQSDDTEIEHSALQFDGLHFNDDLYDYTSEIDYNIPSPMVASVFMTEDLDQLDIQNQQQNQISNDGFELCSMESLQYHCSENTNHESKLTCTSSPSCGDLHYFRGMTSHLDIGVEHIQESRIMNLDYFEHELLRDNASVIETPMNDKRPVMRDVSLHAKDRKDPDLFHEENSIPNVHQSASSYGSSSTPRTVEGDAGLHAKDRKDPDLFHEENSIPYVYQSASSHGSSSTPRTVENGICFKVGDCMEVLRVAGMSCMSSEAMNLGNQFDAENNFQTIESFKLHNDRNDLWDKVKEECESQDIMKCKEMSYGITNASYSYFSKELEETEHSLYSPDCSFCKTNSSDKSVSHSKDISSTLLKRFPAYIDSMSQVDLKCSNYISCNQSEELLSGQSLPGLCKWDQKGKCAMTSNRAIDINSSSCFIEDDGSHEETASCKQKASEVLKYRVMLPCVSNDEEVVGAAVVNSGTDTKELENDCQDLVSNTPGKDDCKKCPTVGDDANDLCGKVATTQVIGDGGQRVIDMITNDVGTTYCDDVSYVGSFVTNQTSTLTCNDGNQECQNDTGPVYRLEHTCEAHIQEEINPEDESVHSFETIVETEEGSIELPRGKPQKKLLLKSVLGGAAAAGFLFMFLHLRAHKRNVGGKDAQPNKPSSHKGKENIKKYSPRKVKRSGAREGVSVYPSEKIRLK